MSSIPLDSVSCPLSGVNLIEAAAGTGKTYNIQNLVLRLVVEKNLPIEKILLLTYTKAAAAELRERVRKVLYLALHSPGEREKRLLEHAASGENGIDREEIFRRIRTALGNFDESCISTIHGFCQRILGECAFESAVRFRVNLETNTHDLLTELCEDYYRMRFYDGSAGHFSILLAQYCQLDVAKAVKIAKLFLARPDLVTTGADIEPEPVLRAHQAWQRIRLRKDRTAALVSLEGLLNKPYRKQELLELANLLEQLDSKDPAYFSAICSLTPEALRAKCAAKTDKTLLEKRLSNPFFIDCQIVAHGIRDFETDYYVRCRDFVCRKFAEHRKSDNFQTFDDLVRQLRDALDAPDGRLKKLLQNRYPAGIIDEFQDTDPVQYAIFHRIFLENPQPAFFMVGDPRQAIYAFRGGDIATYLQAAKELDDFHGIRYSLSENFRSSAPMIRSVNELFGGCRNPFGDPCIVYPTVSVPNQANGLPEPGLRRGGEEVSRTIEIVDTEKGSQAVCASVTATEIASLLANPEILLPGDPPRRIRPEDIAVLVSTHYTSHSILKELQQRDIPCCLARSENVFSTEEAKNLIDFMEAVADPMDRKLFFRALAGPIGGFYPAELIDLKADINGLKEGGLHEIFQHLRQLWREESFLAMFRGAMNAFDAYRKISLAPRGERRLTNLIWLADLVQKQAMKQRLDIRSLMEFCRRVIEDPSILPSEECEQPLPSERSAVKFVSIHSSKGLEYPVVVLPDLMGQSSDDIDKLSQAHLDDGRLEYDFSKSSEFLTRASREREQELMRLAYVAFTRAKYLVLVIKGRRNGEGSALEKLLECRTSPFQERPPCEDPGELVLPREKATGDAIHCAEFSGTIDTHWKITSFSGISPEGSDENLADYDENEEDYAGESGQDVLHFPGGAATGNAWHRMFELVDFQGERYCDEWRKIARSVLFSFGLLQNTETADARVEDTCSMLRNVLHSPLEDGHCRFSLSEIAMEKRSSEMEFFFRFRGELSLARLEERLAGYARDVFGLEVWPESEKFYSGGFVNGFLDLLFEYNGKYYVLDWKSNRLKGNLRNFEPEGLKIAVRDDFYFLQYLFYSVALVKFLKMRLGRFGEAEYERYFGGVFYLFVRGVSPAHPQRGVFFERPKWALLADLEEMFQ